MPKRIKPVATTAKLIEKSYITNTVIEVKFELEKEVPFVPGQFLKVKVTEPFWRPYSILSYDRNVVTLVIEVKDPGKGSDFFKNIQIGDKTEVLGSIGSFTLQNKSEVKNFIATGTGIAPFVPMIKNFIFETTRSVNLICGYGYYEQDLALKYLQDEILNKQINYVQCISRENTSNDKSYELFAGRVTGYLETADLNWIEDEFYICGGSHVIKDVKALLMRKKASNIYIENWG